MGLAILSMMLRCKDEPRTLSSVYLPVEEKSGLLYLAEGHVERAQESFKLLKLVH